MALSTILPYLIFVCVFLHMVTSSPTYSNITLGSSLIAGDAYSSWVSPSKNFAFGFQQMDPGSFLLVIWFNRIPEKTIVWSANRDHLALKGSKVELTTGRSLILTDPSGREIWKANNRKQTLAYAAMLDIGNFVLVTRDSAVAWQSFDEPSDTLLPTQTLKQGSRLIASFSRKNYSSGRFTFDLGFNGNLALYTQWRSQDFQSGVA